MCIVGSGLLEGILRRAEKDKHVHSPELSCRLWSKERKGLGDSTTSARASRAHIQEEPVEGKGHIYPGTETCKGHARRNSDTPLHRI